jgi:hypothetical protein
MVYQGIFYINLINTCLKIKYSKLWYLVDICNKVVIAIKTLDRLEMKLHELKNRDKTRVKRRGK